MFLYYYIYFLYNITGDIMKELYTDLVNWYVINKRDFPWRKDHNPYHIWISEIMLQQTTTSAVIPYFNQFIQRFPDIQTLASASLDDVYKLWEGLGYYRRAKHIHETSIILSTQYNNNFPQNYNDVLNLKGIGPYSAGAICSIAFNQKVAAIDGNVLRIMSRVLNTNKNIAKTSTQKFFKQYIEDNLLFEEPSKFNQALMDLGATICRVKKPKCDQCPIQSYCLAYKNNQQDVLPINIKNIKHNEEFYTTGIITYKDKIMLIKNKKGLLENLYGLIQYHVESLYTFIDLFKEDYNIDIEVVSYIDKIKHVFTHKTCHLNIYEFKIDKPNQHLYTLDEIEKLAISNAHQKAIKAYLKSKEL